MSRMSTLSDRARARLDELFAEHEPLIPKPQVRFSPPLRDHIERRHNGYLASDPTPLEKVVELQARTLASQHACISMLDERLRAIEGRLDRQAGVILKLVDVVLSDEPDVRGADMSAPEASL